MKPILHTFIAIFLLFESPVFSDQANPPAEPPPRVLVVGNFSSPGFVPWTSDLTFLSACNAAGGWNDFANRKSLLLVRNSKFINVNVREIMKDPSKDFHLEPGDVVYLPQLY